VTKQEGQYIAERKLLASKKGDHKKTEVVIRITGPYVARQQDVSFPVDGQIAGCRVSIVGIDEPEFEVFGTDTMQAINIASNLEPLLQRLSTRFDFFWNTGEPYFED
jgi:hypothetical protein